MAADVSAARPGHAVTLVNANRVGHLGCAPGIEWDRVERRRNLVVPGSGAMPAGEASPEGVLGSALVHALRQIVRGELEVRLTPMPSVQASRWMTPPAACRLTGVPVKTIRTWVRDGRIPKRLKNRGANPKQQKYLVNVDDVIATAERVSASESAASEPLNVPERAREILAARAARRR